MALTSSERSLCNKMVADFDGLIAPAAAAKSRVRALARDFENQLRDTIWSSDSAITDSIEEFEDNLSEILPGDSLQDVQDIKDLIDNCDFLGVLSPVSAIAGTTLGVFEGAERIIEDLSSAVPEYSAGGIADAINKILNGLALPFGDQISELLKKADQLIECLATVCGGEYPAQITEFTDTVNQLYNDMNLVDNPSSPNYGEFNYANVYSDVGLDTSQIDNITRVVDTISTGNETATAAIDSSMEAIKNVTRGFGIGGS